MRPRLVLAACLTAGQACGGDLVAAQPAEPLRTCWSLDRAASAMDTALIGAMSEYRVPGAAIAVVVGGTPVVLQGFGCADLGTGEAVDPYRTRFRIASVSKVFVAAAAVQLAETGEVDLYTDVNAYLRDVRVPATYAEPITLHHLLTHTAGFEERVVGYAARTADDVEQLGAFLARRLPARGWEAGDHTGYSNLGYALAAHVLEEASGIDFAALVRRRILEPAGMSATAYVGTPEAASGLPTAVGYRCAEVECSPVPPDFRSAYPAGGLLSTGADMAGFVASLTAGDSGSSSFLSSASRDRLLARQFSHDPRLPGIAYAFSEGEWKGTRTLSHSGGIPGFASLLVLVPEAEAGIFVVVNGGSSEFGAVARDLLLGAALDSAYGVGSTRAAAAQAGVVAGSGRGAADLAGAYRLTRLARRTIENLPSLFAGQLHVETVGVDTVAVTGLGDADGVYVREGSDLWRAIDGGALVSVRRDPAGEITHLFGSLSFFGSPFPAAFERLAWYDEPGFVNEALTLLIVPLLSLTILWPAGAAAGWVIRKVRRKSAVARARPKIPIAIAMVGAVMIVWFAFGFVAVTVRAAETGGGEIVYGMPAGMAGLSLAPWVVVAIAALMIVWMVRAWKSSWWSLVGRLCFTLATVTLISSLAFLAHWSYLPARF